MITKSDSPNTYDIGDYYSILGQDSNKQRLQYLENIKIKKVEENFSYDSGTNLDFLTIDNIRTLIKRYIDPDFTPI